MDYEHGVKMIPIDPNLPQEVENLIKEGWQLTPNIMPVAIYHIISPRVSAPDFQVKLAIDDSKIGILRNGKIIG